MACCEWGVAMRVKMNARVRLWLLALLATFSLAALAVFPLARACADDGQDALYDPIVVSVTDDAAAGSTTDLMTCQETIGNYRVVLNGVTAANKDALIAGIAANMDADAPVKFVNQAFVDADKY